MGISLPSFFGYYVAHTGIMANQAGLSAINHNIANANTEGYSRQRVDMSANSPYPPATRSNYIGSGQLGQGVSILDVSRVHDVFLDGQLRTQQSVFNTQQTLRDGLQQVEGILNEPGDNGASSAISDFFAATRAMSINPEQLATRVSFMQSAQRMLDVFQQQAQQLQDLRTNITGNASDPGSFASSLVALTANEINSHLSGLANINAEIVAVSAAGATPNDLLDRRDQLLNELSELVNISVDYKPSGVVNISLNGNALVRGSTLSDTLEVVENPGPAPDPDDVPALVQLASDSSIVNGDITGGMLGGYLQLAGNTPGTTTIRSVLESMDTLFNEIATNINALQATGRDLNGNVPTPPDDQIFIPPVGPGLSIFGYTLNNALKTDLNLIAAALDDSGFAGVGDGRNATLMAALETSSQAALGNASYLEYFNALVSEVGVSANAAASATENVDSAIQQIEQRRQSVQGVNMEEEMIDMLRFQRGFEASAKLMSTIDSVFDTIINRIF